MTETLREHRGGVARQAETAGRTLHHRVVIVGGGTAGITTAAWLKRARPSLDVALIEPSSKHYYQPLWTLVGGGEARKEDTERDEVTLIPRGVTWLQDAVEEFEPETRFLWTQDGRQVSYDFLVVAAGIQLDWGKIPGLRENLGQDGVCSNYSYEHVDKTWEFIRSFQGGTAIFTQPGTPIKCGGAPQKIMYLAEDYFRRAGLREQTRVVFASAAPSLFPVPRYAPALERIVRTRGIETLFGHDLVEIRAKEKKAIFALTGSGVRVAVPYDLLHVTPPQSAPHFLKISPLANTDGWVEVDAHRLQHVRYPNVFALGDCSSAPTSKTGAAIRKQAPVVVKNLLAAMEGKPLTARYGGYTSCPLVTGYGRLILAEFDYDKQPAETFPFDQSKERSTMYLLKKHLLPQIYWHGMLKGRM